MKESLMYNMYGIDNSFGFESGFDANELNEEESQAAKVIKNILNEKYNRRILQDGKDPVFRSEFEKTTSALLQSQYPDIHYTRRNFIVKYIIDNIFGLGPLENLLDDPNITEIMVVRYDKIYIEKDGKLQLAPAIKFESEEALQTTIHKILEPIGGRINQTDALADGRLDGGERINAVFPPISPKGAQLSIRKPSKHKLTGEDYLRFKTLDEKMLKFLQLAVGAETTTMVCGGTGSGKTTLLNLLSNYINPSKSIITIEDTCELQLQQDNVRTLEARHASVEGKGEVTQRMLVKNALRQRPDVLCIGEIRDGVLVDFFRAASSGHEGSLTTVHTNSPQDCIESTLPLLFGMSDMHFTPKDQKILICSALQLLVQVNRLRDGSRKITNITHIVGFGKAGAYKLDAGFARTHKSANKRRAQLEAELKAIENGTWRPEDFNFSNAEIEEKIYIQDIFRFEETGMDSNGKIIGRYVATGYKPLDIIEKIKRFYPDEDVDALFVKTGKADNDEYASIEEKPVQNTESMPTSRPSAEPISEHKKALEEVTNIEKLIQGKKKETQEAKKESASVIENNQAPEIMAPPVPSKALNNVSNGRSPLMPPPNMNAVNPATVAPMSQQGNTASGLMPPPKGVEDNTINEKAKEMLDVLRI